MPGSSQTTIRGEGKQCQRPGARRLHQCHPKNPGLLRGVSAQQAVHTAPPPCGEAGKGCAAAQFVLMQRRFQNPQTPSGHGRLSPPCWLQSWGRLFQKKSVALGSGT